MGKIENVNQKNTTEVAKNITEVDKNNENRGKNPQLNCGKKILT